MNSLYPALIAYASGPLLGFLIRFGVRLIGTRRAGAGRGVEGDPPLTGRLTDLIILAVCVAAIVVVCSINTPRLWEIAFLFSALWPVIFDLVLPGGAARPRGPK